MIVKIGDLVSGGGIQFGRVVRAYNDGTVSVKSIVSDVSVYGIPSSRFSIVSEESLDNYLAHNSKGEIESLLMNYEFEEAESLFSKRSKYIDADWYQEEKRVFEDKQFQEISDSHKKRIEYLLQGFEFDEAQSIFDENNYYVDQSWFSTCKEKYEQEYIRIEQERIKKEKIRLEKEHAMSRLANYFSSDFLRADSLYTEHYSKIIPYEEYVTEKNRFVHTWVKENTRTELDNEQSRAIAEYGKHIQVIARAGSGKTTTLVNRAIFLQGHCHIPPNQIILLAFNRKAAEEIKERLEAYFGDNLPHVMTFHALAYAIVHPEESLLYDDPSGNVLAKSQSLQSVIDDFLHDPIYKGKIRNCMLSHFSTDWERIISGGYNLERPEFIKYRRSLPNISLRGEYLKSHGEKLIADFLFEHDIDYKYERNYWWKGVNYRPDFTIFLSHDSGLIVEYFGLIGNPDYDELTAQKRGYWQNKEKWSLLEITPNLVAPGRADFFTYFKTILEANGVTCTPLSDDEIWHRIKDRAIDRFTTTAVGFIQRCRKLSITPDQLNRIILSQKDLSTVEQLFLDIAQHLYGAYLDRLEATGEEDFDGLMQRAANIIQQGETVFERKSGKGDLKDIRYMFIDEYQDFSNLFHQLVEAIRAQNDTIEFFCVGDDWQAINGFAGSDLQFYESFKKYFAPSQELYISTNYRSTKSIVNLGNALMAGLGKPAKTSKLDQGSIFLCDLEGFIPSHRENERHSGDEITPAALRLVSKLLSKDKNVVLLSRRNSLPWYVNYSTNQSRKYNGIDAYCDLIRSYFPEEIRSRISTSTAHKYKGLQNDAVIVIDAVFRSYPLIHPDWIFTRVLGDSLDKIISEERRLFYVALTRAVDTLIIITEASSISPFLEDITSRHKMEYLNWDKYPPIQDANSRLTVRVGNLNLHNNSATYAIKDQLKANGYRWDSRNKVWQKSFLAEGFTIDKLKASLWSPIANEVCVNIVDDHESSVGEYVIHSGQWSSLR